MPADQHVILIHPQAPRKADLGAPCNGCGVCCLLEPCPLGVVLSRRRHGACVAVFWEDSARQYRCSAVSAPERTLCAALPAGLKGFAPGLARVLRRLAKRWIAAGRGCDCSLETVVSREPQADPDNSPTMEREGLISRS